MALLYPDILEHNNPNNPLMDDSQLNGGLRVVSNKTARNNVPIAKRKVGALVNWIEDGEVVVKKFVGVDVTDLNWQNDSNWGDINHPFFSLNIMQTLNWGSTTTFSVGNKNVFGSVFIHYQITRDSSIAMGVIQIVQNISTLEFPVYFTIREINSIGLVGITSAFNGDNIEVSIELDGSSTSNGTMTYNLECYIATFLPPAWIQQTSPVAADHLNSTYFIDANNGWAVGQAGTSRSLILNTVDGGANWVEQTDYNPIGSLNGVAAFDALTAWAVGRNVSDVAIISTVDGGTTWDQQTSPVVSGELLGVKFIDANNGYAVGNQGISTLILHTTDGGSNWIEQSSFSTLGKLYGVHFADANNGWAVGASGGNILIINTVNGGTNWTQQTSPVIVGTLYSVYFINANNGWAVGNDGFNNNVILHTVDGGANWVQQTSPVVSGNLKSTFFLNTNNGWISGVSGGNNDIILVTTDGGANWIEQSTPIVFGELLSIYMLNNNLGFAVGDNVTGAIRILKYTS